MGTMSLLVKNRMKVPVQISKKSRYQWTMCALRVLNNDLLQLQVEKFWEVISMGSVLNTSENIHSGMTQYLGLLESGYVTDRYSVPSGNTLSIDNGISWIFILEPSFCS